MKINHFLAGAAFMAVGGAALSHMDKEGYKACHIDADGGLSATDGKGEIHELSSAWRLSEDGSGRKMCVAGMSNGVPTESIPFKGQRKPSI